MVYREYTTQFRCRACSQFITCPMCLGLPENAHCCEHTHTHYSGLFVARNECSEFTNLLKSELPNFIPPSGRSWSGLGFHTDIDQKITIAVFYHHY